MSVNTLSYEQISTVLNDLTKQVTGEQAVTAVDAGNFTSVATKLLRTGTDPLLAAISQMVGRTIFSVRPYNRKLSGIQVDNQRWGYITRKLAVADKDFENDNSFVMADGGQYSHWYVNMPNVLQLNYYGQNAFEKSVSIFKNQLDGAFASRDSMARMTLGNFISGKIAGSNGVIHLVTEYNAFAGTTLTWAQIKASASEYERFIKWMYSRVATISEMMTERTTLYQMNVDGKPITRHTPKDRQKIYMIADFLNAMKSMVLSGVFNDDFLQYADTEAINYWQSPLDPYAINMKAAYLNTTTGDITEQSAAVNNGDIVGVIFDEDALGLTVMDTWTQNTGMNAKYGYDTTYFHYLIRFWNDFTEKGLFQIECIRECMERAFSWG